MLTLTRDEQIVKITSQCFKKRRYDRETDARFAAQKRESAGNVLLRVYKCHICEGFHLSSKWRNKRSG